MKILLTIHHNLNPNSGASGSTFHLGQCYEKLGHEVTYYSYDNLPKWLPEKLHSLTFPEFVSSYISQLVQLHHVDVVDASTGDAWVWAKWLQHLFQRPPLLVARSHGLEHIAHLERLQEFQRGNLRLSWKYPLYYGGFRLWEVATSMCCADLVFLLNQRDRHFAITQLGVSSAKAHLVANGIPEKFLNLKFEPTPLSQNAPLGIVQLGTYIPRKGIHYSAPALNKILINYPEVKVSFLGTACPEAKVYADFAPQVHDRIQVVPYYSHDSLPTLLRGHQIKVLASLSEGFAKALIEAMACGLAPVATAIPGPIDFIKDNHNGILVPSRDQQAIEQALKRLILERTYLDQLRHHAYATAQEYCWIDVAQKRLSLYQQAQRHKYNFDKKKDL